jgi:hypothetical protein
MNIFAVDENPTQAAKDLPDKLVIKLPVESNQMLAPWLFKTQGKFIQRKDGQNYGVKGFAHHPCSLWLYESLSNVKWLLDHALGLCQEYEKRFNKQHACLKSLLQVFESTDTEVKEISSSPHTPFALAMPEQYKSNDAVNSYRNYLMSEKGYCEWNKGEPPLWWNAEKHRPAREIYLAERERKRLLRTNARKIYNNPS